MTQINIDELAEATAPYDELLVRLKACPTSTKVFNTYNDTVGALVPIPRNPDGFEAATAIIALLDRLAKAEAARDEALKPATEIEIEDAEDEEDEMGVTTVYNEITHGYIIDTEGNLTRKNAAKIINAFLAHRRSLKRGA